MSAAFRVAAVRALYKLDEERVNAPGHKAVASEVRPAPAVRKRSLRSLGVRRRRRAG